MCDNLYNDKFGVVDLLILLQQIHHVKNGTQIYIHYDTIEDFQVELEYKAYDSYLNVEDFENFNTEDFERFNNTNQKVFEFFDNCIQITFNERVIHDYDSWNFDENRVQEIIRTWYEATYNIDIVSLITSEIAVDEYFVYENKLYKCCKDSSNSFCDECCFNDNGVCAVKHHETIGRCNQYRYDNTDVYYKEIKLFDYNGEKIFYPGVSNKIKKEKTSISNPIDDSKKHFEDGDIFKMNNKYYMCKSGGECTNCVFYNKKHGECTIVHIDLLNKCFKLTRNDNHNVHYVKFDITYGMKYYDLDIYLNNNVQLQSNKSISNKNLVDLDKVISLLPNIKDIQIQLSHINNYIDDIIKNENNIIDNISISYNNTHNTTINNNNLSQQSLNEIREIILQKLQNHKIELENEIKKILTK